MTEDAVRSAMKRHVGGLWTAATDLLVRMDDPRMTIDQLRASRSATMFRAQVIAYRNWMLDVVRTLPNAFTPEEKKFLEFWFKQMDTCAPGGEHLPAITPAEDRR